MHAPDQPTAIHLELRLAGTARPDATGLLAERGSSAPQARQPIAQQRELDLCLALGTAGVLGEDVEDDRGAVDRRAAEQPLEVAVLGRGELVVEDDRIGVEAFAERGDLGGFAPSDERGWVGRVATLHDPPDDIGSGAVDQLGQLVELLGDPLGGPTREDDADQDDPLPDSALNERPG